ncbi:MAG: sugar phosphate isomerase/epimerase [Clostridia bacterium]|nr:sugar phosphate isomerase/epimerase [Clostridia bacterium]
MFRTGISSCSKVLEEPLFRAYAEAGIETMEVSPNQGGFDELDFAKIKRLADSHGVALWSFHLQYYPFTQIDISAPDPALRRKSVQRLCGQIERASQVGINKFVVHPGSEPIGDHERREHLEAAKESLCELAEFAAHAGGVIAAEDLPRTCPGRDSAEMAELLAADGRIRVCFDTNHLLREDPVDFVRAVGKKIVTLHVSDYDFTDEKHWLPGEGKINWQELIAALKEAGYSGVWMYELGFAPPRTLHRSRDLTCADFAANARALFAGETPPRVE